MNIATPIRNILADRTGTSLLIATEVEIALLKSWLGGHADKLRLRSAAIKVARRLGWTCKGIVAIMRILA